MKKIKSFLLLMGITIISFIFTTTPVFCQQSFPFKNGIVRYLETTFHGEKLVQILYVDGSKTAIEKYRNDNIYEIFINDGKYIYTIFPESKKGRKSKITDSLKGTLEMFNQIEENWEKNKIGEELILGKKCDIYRFITRFVNKKIWRWEELVLKEQAFGENGEINYNKAATDIKIDIPIQEEKFQVPVGIDIKEIKNWDDQQAWLKETEEQQWLDLPQEKRKKAIKAMEETDIQLKEMIEKSLERIKSKEGIDIEQLEIIEKSLEQIKSEKEK